MRSSFRSFLYILARLMGDYNAVKKGRAGRRVGEVAVGGKHCDAIINMPGMSSPSQLRRQCLPQLWSHN